MKLRIEASGFEMSIEGCGVGQCQRLVTQMVGPLLTKPDPGEACPCCKRKVAMPRKRRRKRRSK